jgi:hypothetical protein
MISMMEIIIITATMINDNRFGQQHMGYHGEPFRWDDSSGRRAELRAELDAYYARL